MEIVSKLKLLLRRDISPEEFERLTLQILSDGQPRTVYQLQKEAQRRSGKFVPGASLNTYLMRLVDDGRLVSEWRTGGRVYSLRR